MPRSGAPGPVLPDTVASNPAADPPRQGHIPGEGGVWMLIAGDGILFSLLFGLFLFYRADNPAMFAESQALLSTELGLLNTVLLLTSSWLVASAIRAARAGKPGVMRGCLTWAIACSLGFMAVKAVEYTPKIASGITLSSNDFFMLYYVYTAIHLIHVVIGTGVLLTMRAYAGEAPYSANALRNFESGASFWHLVDLLWIVLFALLFLIN